MSFGAVIYFGHLGARNASVLAEAIVSLEVELEYAGKQEPLDKWVGGQEELVGLLSNKIGVANFSILEFDDQLSSMTIYLCADERDSSTIQIVGYDKGFVDNVAMILARALNAYACASTEHVDGQSPNWSIISQSERCPTAILEVLGDA